MGRDQERSGRDKVLRRLDALLKATDFRRTKPTFFTRQGPHAIEFIHVHKFTFGPAFRIHAGLRVLEDPFDAIHLNGPDSGGSPAGRDARGARLQLSYAEDDASIQQCAEAIARWCTDVAEPWFRRWRSPDRLLRSPESPLDQRGRDALAGKLSDAERATFRARTSKLLGTDKPSMREASE